MTSQYIFQLSSFHQISSFKEKNQRFLSKGARKLISTFHQKWVNQDFSVLRLNKGARAQSPSSDSGKKIVFESVIGSGNGVYEPFRGRPGSVSFYGLTHHMVEGTKSESTRLKSGSGSLLWLAGCVVFILSYTMPPVFIGGLVNLMIKNMSLAEIVVSLSSEAAFYAGVAAFLIITDRVQRPYMQTSPRRWSLINGLRGYSLSAYIATGLKILLPLFAVYISWPDVGLDGLITVAPFLLSCLTQLVFEVSLRKRGSSCWPLVPIIFEMYRMYQVNRAVYFIEQLVYAMGEVPKSPNLLERGDTLVGMVVILQALGLVCLWSLITFLVRLLFPCTLVVDDGK